MSFLQPRQKWNSFCLKDNFASYRILGWQLFSFSIFKKSFLFLLASIVAVLDLIIRLNGAPLKIIPSSTTFTAAFKNFSFVFVFLQFRHIFCLSFSFLIFCLRFVGNLESVDRYPSTVLENFQPQSFKILLMSYSLSSLSGISIKMNSGPPHWILLISYPFFCIFHHLPLCIFWREGLSFLWHIFWYTSSLSAVSNLLLNLFN